MRVQPVRGLLESLQQIPDPRGREGLRHPLSAMLAAVVCATFCGFRGLRQTVQWLNLHGVTMWHLLGFRRKPPCRQTFANVLAEIDADLLEQLLLMFVDQLDLPEATASPSPSTSSNDTGLDVEIWDGKTLRGTRRGERRAEQVLVRMQQALGKVLSSTAIPADTNEAKTALELVRNLVLKGKLVVADATDCQRDWCQAIVGSGGDYLVTVKGNQPQLLRDVEQAFVISEAFPPPPCAVREELAIRQTAKTTEKNRGRLETRPVTTTTNLIDAGYLDWPEAQQLIRLERQTLENDQTRSRVTYAITSLTRATADAEFLLKSLRGRWGIENRGFYVLDTALGEDACRIRTGAVGRNLNVLRLSLLNFARCLGQSVGHLCREHTVKPHLLLQRLRIFKN